MTWAASQFVNWARTEVECTLNRGFGAERRLNGARRLNGGWIGLERFWGSEIARACFASKSIALNGLWCLVTVLPFFMFL